MVAATAIKKRFCIIFFYNFIFSLNFLLPAALYAQIPITLTPTLPVSVTNNTKQFFRPMFSQMGESCGNANGIGFAFTYEIDCARNVSASSTSNQYPYCHTYHFLNGGSDGNGTSHMYVDAMNIVRENGIPTVSDYGGFTDGFPTKWLSGYDLWYKAMQNRVDKIDSISVLDSAGLRKVKQWVYDHGNGSANGGVANFGCSAYGWQEGSIATGVEAGKTIMTKYGSEVSGDHGQTICGYNDSIKIDVNKDGKYTKNLDVNSDGKVDLSDWEVGAFLVANSWGTGYFDNGFYYAPYRLFAMTMAQGGIMNGNRACIMTVKPTYKPKMTFKASITHTLRNQIAISVGVAPNQNATTPTKTRTFKHQFNFAGGAYPMCGKGLSTTIEIGLDISDLLDSVSGSQTAVLFLIVDAKGSGGTVNSLSVMDYSSGGAPLEIKSTQTNVAISTKTYVSVTITTPVKYFAQPGFRHQAAVRSVRGVTQVRFPLNAIDRVSLSDLNGKIIRDESASLSSEWIALPRSLRPGMYFVNARSRKGESVTVKVRILK
jgi:hypothetical protein